MTVKRKSMFLKLLATYMSLLVLLGTVGIQADFHVCQGNIKAFSLWGDAQKCSPLELNEACTHDHTVAKTKCCNDKEVFSSTTFQTDIAPYGIIKTSFEALLYSNVSPILVKTAPKTTNLALPPPLIPLQKSLIIAFQQFII